MSTYVDGFVLVVPKNKKQAYKKMANEAKELWTKHGVLGYYECRGDDLDVKEMGDMKTLSFVKMAKAKPGDDVWFSFIIYKSKKHRDEVNAKVMEEMGKHDEYKDMEMPFDMDKMAQGGFAVEVEG